MYEKMVSIILPVYNAKKYIKQALDSILSQTYKSFEVIIVDDGATDGTGNVCKKYAEKYENVRYILQSNSGVCSARNRGIREARGEYICFCDHDDEYKSTYLEKLVEFAKKNDLDMAKCGAKFIDIDKDDKIHRIHKETFTDSVLTRLDLIKDFFDLPDSYYDVWNGLYRTSLLQESEFQFNENFVYGMEDYDFNTRIIDYINKIGFVSDCLYVHYMRMNQSTSGKFRIDRIKDIADYQEVTYKVLKSYGECLVSDWEAVSFGKNIIGIIKYTVRGKREKKEIIEYLSQFTMQFIGHLHSASKINIRYVKYSLLALLAKYGMYNSIYNMWMIKFYAREILLKIIHIYQQKDYSLL